MISPDLFSLKYAWQYTRWFEAKDRKRRLVEAARRAKVRPSAAAAGQLAVQLQRRRLRISEPHAAERVLALRGVLRGRRVCVRLSPCVLNACSRACGVTIFCGADESWPSGQRPCY